MEIILRILNSNRIVLTAAYLVMALLAIFHVFSPFSGDSAFFYAGAKILSNDLLLYRDFWDIKQPGIFYFYYLGGTLFSFTEAGIYLFELVYWFCFSVAAVYLAKSLKLFKNNILYHLIPLFTVGIYLALSTQTDKAQIEILVSAPLILSVLLLSKYEKEKVILPYFIIGILFSVILFLKIPFVVMLGCLTLYHIYRVIRLKVTLKIFVINKLIPALVGFLILPVIYTIGIYKNGTINEVFETFFVIPYNMVGTTPEKHAGAFLERFGRYIAFTFPLGVMSILVILSEAKKNNSFVHMMTVLILSSLLVIYLHYFKWAYYYQLFLFPFAFLSLIYIDRYREFNVLKSKLLIIGLVAFIVFVVYVYSSKFTDFFPKLLIVPLGTVLFFLIGIKKISDKKLWVTFIFVCMFAVTIGKFLLVSYTFVSNFDLKHGVGDGYKDFYNPEYSILKKESEIIKNDTSNYKIYVCGNPIIYYFSNRIQAVPLGGWALEMFSDKQWQLFGQQVIENKPKYIFFDHPYFNMITRKGYLGLIETNYNLISTSKNGNWFRLKEP
jgi:hypothetical protein